MAGSSRGGGRSRRDVEPVAGLAGVSRKAGLVARSWAARLATAGVWVVFGVVALVAVAAYLTAAGSEEQAGSRPVARSRSGAGVAGWARLYVVAYLRAGSGEESQLRRFLPEVDRLPNRPDAWRVRRTAVVNTRRIQRGYWAVTVAADVAVPVEGGGYRSAGLRFYRVGVVHRDRHGRSGFVAAGLPSLVSGPATLPQPELAYESGSQPSSDPAVRAAAGFLTAFLTGRGDVARYTTPGARISPVGPPPFRQVRLRRVSVASGGEDSSTRPRAGARLSLLVVLRASDAAGRSQRLAYALQLQARDGRWEIARIRPAPLLAESRSTG